MLKILIDNEEVVCDKQLEIKEEMLSTSSCILNNCYPKSWENTKDYTSQYYYPKDYSKCVIKDEVNVPAEEGEYATGTDLNINVDNTKEWSYQLQGDTQQETTSGTNLIKFPNVAETTVNGITYSIQDNVISLNGTATDNIRYIYASNFAFNGAGDYRITLLTISGNYTRGVIGISSRNEDKTQQIVWHQVADGGTTNKKTYTAENISQIKNIGMYINSGTVINNLKFKFMFTKGDNIPTTFVPFVGGSTSPNPDYPQNINVVTGEQNIQIVGKNLFDKDSVINNSYINNTGNLGTSSNYYASDYIKVNNYNYITLSGNTYIEVDHDAKIAFYDKNKNFVSYNNIRIGDNIFSVSSNIYYTRFSIRKSDVNNIQLEKGSTATSFELYHSQNYPINLGKNLFDKDNVNYLNAYIGTGTRKITSENRDRTIYIKCKPNTTYTIQKMVQETTTMNRFVVGTTSTVPAIGDVLSDFHYYNGGTTETSLTLTTGANANYLCVFCWSIDTITTFEDMLNSIQIEVGSQATSYAPYFEPIELCKIGDYHDYIYNQNGDWYLHKETNKILLDGDNNKLSYGGIEYGHPLFHKNINDIINVKDYSYLVVMSTSYGTFQQTEGDITSPKKMGNFKIRASVANNRMFVRDDRFTSTNEINDWLQSNNVLAYYVMQNAINTQITDTTLIQQLDNLKNATLFNGVNNISASGNLPAILNLHYNFVTARTDITLLFSGVVKNTGNINLNPRYPHYCNLEVLDFKTFLSECEQLDFVINNKTITEAIEQVTQAVASYGFVVGNININDNTIIGAYSTQEKTPYDVFQYLADISQSRWYTRLVDENTVAIDFYDPTAMQRGIDLDFSNNEFACQNNVEDLSFNYGTYDYRNKQIMLSNQVFGGVDFEETIIADGYNKIFNTTTPIGILKGITVNGSSATFATNEDKEMGVEADFYYTPGNTQIESNENDGTYPANTIIIVGYTPLVKGRQVISDTAEINRIATQTGRNGTISRYEKRNDVLSSDELELIGNSYLKYKGTPEINLTLVTKDVDLYNIGQIVYFNYPNIQDLSKDYMVKSKKTRIINTATDWNIWYSYTLTSNFNSENAINYFDNQRAKASGNIKVGDYITRNVDIEANCMIIFSNPTATEITIADNNILNAPLNAPFTQ